MYLHFYDKIMNSSQVHVYKNVTQSLVEIWIKKATNFKNAEFVLLKDPNTRCRYTMHRLAASVLYCIFVCGGELRIIQSHFHQNNKCLIILDSAWKNAS